MKMINSNLISSLYNISTGHYYSVHNAIVQLMVSTKNELKVEPLYKLFYLINECFTMNLDLLSKTYIDYDILGFAGVKRNTRVAIEAYIDLYNLVVNNDYLMVMKKYNRIDFENTNEQEIYDNYMETNRFNNEYVSKKTKIDIAKKNGMNAKFADYLSEIYDNYSDYSHPNIFVIKNYEYVSKEELDNKELIKLNINLLYDSLKTLSQWTCNKYEYLFEYHHLIMHKQLIYDIGILVNNVIQQ